MKKLLDINVDVGEGFDNEDQILPIITRANIACGGHAGSVELIQRVVKSAKRNSTIIGAHPGFEDKENFGRKKLNISLIDLKRSLFDQIKTIESICSIEQTELSFVKPHGALYHLVCNDIEYAEMFIDLIKSSFSKLEVIGLPNCVLKSLSIKNNIQYLNEGFADRVYENDSNLRSRNLEVSTLNTLESISNQVFSLINKKVQTHSGSWVNIDVDTICFHGDHKGAGKNISSVIEKLKDQNIEVRN